MPANHRRRICIANLDKPLACGGDGDLAHELRLATMHGACSYALGRMARISEICNSLWLAGYSLSLPNAEE